MSETTDVQARFDALAGDVGGRTRGDASRPAAIARRRRRVRYAVAVTAVVAVVTGAAMVGGTAGDESRVDPADSSEGVEPGRPGPLGRENLLRWLPRDSQAAYVADIEAITGTPGVDVDDPFELALAGFVESSLVTLQVAPFDSLTARHLLTFAGSFEVEYRVLELDVAEMEGLLRSAGWEPAGGEFWEAGADVGPVARRVARFVRVQGTRDGPTLVMTGRQRDDLPDVLGSAPPVASLAAQHLIEIGAGAGTALGEIDGTGPMTCSPAAMALDSPTSATLLFYPEDGAPAEVTAEQVTSLDGVTRVVDLATSGGAVRARVEIENPSVPTEILGRLGLPGTTIC